MTLQVGHLLEGFVAELAGVGPFPCVSTNVRDEVAILKKFTFTIRTNVLLFRLAPLLHRR